jgi:hypothetical protein
MTAGLHQLPRFWVDGAKVLRLGQKVQHFFEVASEQPN